MLRYRAWQIWVFSLIMLSICHPHTPEVASVLHTRGGVVTLSSRSSMISTACMMHLRGGADDTHGDDTAVDLGRQREERKKAKAAEKLQKKLVKEATRAECAVGDTEAGAGSGVSYATAGRNGLPEEFYGNLLLVQVIHVARRALSVRS